MRLHFVPQKQALFQNQFVYGYQICHYSYECDPFHIMILWNDHCENSIYPMHNLLEPIATSFCLISVGMRFKWVRVLVWLTPILQYLSPLKFSSKYADQKSHTNFSHWKLKWTTSFSNSVGNWELLWPTLIRQNSVVPNKPVEAEDSRKITHHSEELTE